MTKKIIIMMAIAATALTVFSIMITCETVNELLDTALAIQSVEAQSPASREIHPDINNVPLFFIANSGQEKRLGDHAQFYARTSSYTLSMTPRSLEFLKTDETERPSSPNTDSSQPNWLAAMLFIGANNNPELVPVGILQTHKSVNDSAGDANTSVKSRRTVNIKAAKAIVYKNIYNNIDLKIYGMEKQVEYDWIINPGAKPDDICFQYKNIIDSSVDGKGNLVIITQFGELIHHAPISYQVINGEKVPVPSAFKNYGNHVYGFDIQQYNKFFPLIVDPLIQHRPRTERGNK